MDQTELLARLHSLTSDLGPGRAGPDALHALRRRLAAALRDVQGESPSSHAAASQDSCLATELKLAVAESAEEQIPKGSQLTLVRRLTPILSPLLSEAEHPLAGQTPSRIFGPFVDELGRQVWFDEFLVGPTLQVAWAGRPGVALVLPASIVFPGAQKLQYSNVSIWVAANALAKAAPAGSFAGWKVEHATFEFSSPGTVSGHTLTLPASASCHLTMTPDRSEAAAPPPGPGVDAAEASVFRPDTAELFFDANGLVSLRAGSAGATALGISAMMVRMNDAPLYDAFLGRVLIPFAPTSQSHPHAASKSTLCTLDGQGNVIASAWSPTPSRAVPDQLGDAGSGGAIVLTVAGDFTADTPGIKHGPIRLGRSYVFADRGTIGWIAPAAINLTASYALSLWGRSAIRVAFDESFPLLFLSSRLGLESAQYRGSATASLDQPRQADGATLPVKFARTVFSFIQSAAGISIFGAAADPQRRGLTALALSNGLFTVSPPSQINWVSVLSSSEISASGNLELQFGVWQLLPTLPDPYATNFGPDFRADAPRGLLRARISWTGQTPKLSFTVETGVRADGSPVLIPQPLDTPLAHPDAERMRSDFYTFVHQRPLQLRQRIPSLWNLRLLDVSTNSDQLGVNISFWDGSGGTIRVDGVDLVSLGGPVEVFMLPQVQWEPVRVIQNPKVGILPDELASPDDGGPALIAARTVRLEPIAPLAIAAAVVDAHNQDLQQTGAFFTLPFGIRALAVLDPQSPFTGTPPTIQLRRQAFDDSYTAATQVRLEASPALRQIRRERGHVVLFRRPPLLPGVARQLAQARDMFNTPIVFPDGSTQPPPFSVLDPLDHDFNATFAGGPAAQVPIERIDLSGYGASIFSNWVNDTSGTGITNVRFEVLVGRTRYEVLRMQSKLIPCDAVVVRTITLERRGSGAVYRWDSGWVAVTDGLFEWRGSDVRFHTGAVQGFLNIREIRDTRGTIPIAGAEVEAVHFDCDIAIDHAERGTTSGNRVPALNQLGFVQRIPLPFPPGSASPLSVPPLNADQLRQLLERFDPVGGNVDCMVNIGGSGQEIRVTGVFSSTAPTDGPGVEFAVACYGSLVVPRNEQWTMIRSSVSSGDVVPVDAHRGVPLVRRGGTTVTPASGPYRIVEPQDLIRTDPAVAYGIQLTTRTNRLVFLRPEITPGVNAIAGAVPPVMADPFVLAGVGGAFPPLKRCLHLTVPGYRLDLAAGGYRWSAPPAGMSFTIPELPTLSRFLVKSGAFDLRADYAGKLVRLVGDSAAPWSINIPDVPAVLDVHTPDLGKDIIKVVSDLYSPGAAGLTPPQILFGGALATAKDIITALQSFLPSLDTPPLDIDLSAPRLDDPSLRLRIAARFPICNTDGSAIDIGIGKFRGELGVGTEIQVGLAGFGGRIFFSVQGEIQQPLLPKLLYVGGSLFLEIQIDQSGKPGVRLITSAVASVGGDLIPGLVSLEGSVSYGYFLDTTHDPFVPGVALGMELRAKLLSGFLGVRFRADVAVGIIPVPPPVLLGLPRDLLISGQFTAQVSVVALWVFEEDFSKTFRFEQKVPGLVAGAFAVGTGLVPVPV